MLHENTPVEFKYKGFGESDLWSGTDTQNANPNAMVAIRVYETWIPGDTTYLAGSLTSFWVELLKRIQEIHHGRDSGILWMEEMLFSFERVSETDLRISSHVSEAAITDESQRIGIEASATIPFDVFVAAAIKSAEDYLTNLKISIPDSTDDRAVLDLSETLQNVRTEFSELDTAEKS